MEQNGGDRALRDKALQFASASAPFLSHLEALHAEYPSTHALQTALLSRCDEVRTASRQTGEYTCINSGGLANRLQHSDEPIIMILDLDSDSHVLNKKCELSLQQISGCAVRQLPADIDAVDRFLGHLSIQAQDYTRIVLLRVQSWLAEDRYHTHAELAPAELFFAHVLGIVLQLRPLEVARIISPEALRSNLMPNYQTPVLSALDSMTATFGVSRWRGSGCHVHYMEQDPRDQQSHGTVIIRMDTRWLRMQEWNGGNLVQKLEIPGPIDASSPPAFGTSRILSAYRLAVHGNVPLAWYEITLRNILSSDIQALNHERQNFPHIANLQWLQAIITLESSVYEARYTTLAESCMRSLQAYWEYNSRAHPEFAMSLAGDISSLLLDIQHSRTELSYFLSRLLPEALIVSCDKKIGGRLDRLIENVQRRLTEADRLVAQRAHGKTFELSETSIEESKAAMSLTSLATVFIPISLASSIFGMNIQEINGTGLDIWVFILTVIVALLLTLLGWKGWKGWQVFSPWIRRAYGLYRVAIS